MRKKPLLDVLAGRFPLVSRDVLYARVLCGEVVVDGERFRDPKTPVRESAHVDFDEKRYVSRGGQKLEHALTRSKLSVHSKIILDVGASTGGFTDCLLQHGAKHVHSVDVGVNQLAYALRVDSRVSVHENTNIMSLSSLDPCPAIAVADMSFRSIRGAASRILDLCGEQTALVLVKPQFEWMRRDEEFDGVLRDAEKILAVLLEVVGALTREAVYVENVVASPIAGRKGNREFFFLLGRNREEEAGDLPGRLRAMVEESL